MQRKNVSRRNFMQKAAAGSAVLALTPVLSPTILTAQTGKPALLGGQPVRTTEWPAWPEWRPEWEEKVLDVLRSGRWWLGRGEHVLDFENAYAKLLGARRCLATASGTTALQVSLHVLGVDAGDEVIVSPFTFIASYDAILLTKALPVFADTDPATFTIDPASIAGRFTERTAAIMPVHIYGLPCDMHEINAVAMQRSLPVVEDACQAWLAEYHGKKCGTLGQLGCFSFQNSKHLPTGEGGAITGDDDNIMDKCHSFHNCGRPYGSSTGATQYFTRGSNYRMAQIPAVMLIQQFDKLQMETTRRQENAAYLAKNLGEIPGVTPAKLPENSRAAWHTFPFRYEAAAFNGLARASFINAMRAEGIPCGAGYHEQYFDGSIDEAINSRGFKRLFSEQRLKDYRDSLHDLPGNRQVCETSVTFSQNMLLGGQKDMDTIIDAVLKIQQHSAEILAAS